MEVKENSDKFSKHNNSLNEMLAGKTRFKALEQWMITQLWKWVELSCCFKFYLFIKISEIFIQNGNSV